MKRGGVLLAGGIGSRFGAEKPKQFLPLLGRAVLDYSLEVLLLETDVLCVVCHRDWMDELRFLLHWKDDLIVVEGGSTRQESVFRGLSMLASKGVDVVAIHDGARPLLTQRLCQRGWEKLRYSIAAIPVVPVHQTVAYVHDGHIQRYAERKNLVAIQTPQFFRFDVIMQAHEKARQEGINDLTDDSQLLQKEGFCVDTIDGDPWNIKITLPEDILLAEAYLSQGGVRR